MLIKQILKDWGLEALILFLFVWVLVPFGPGVTFDSVSFFEAGDHFWSRGEYTHVGPDGYQEFAAHRFPMYPLILSLFSGHWWLILLQTSLFAGSILFFRWFLNLLKAPKYFLLLFATVPFILNYYCLWTEGLYGLFFLALLVYLKKEENYQPIIWIALIVTLLCLTRIVGITIAGSLLVAYLMEYRARRGMLIFALGTTVLLFWTLIGAYFLGSTARTFAQHPIDLTDTFYLLVEFGKWFTPAEWVWIPFVIGILIVLFPLALAIRFWKSRMDKGILFWFLIIHFYAYLVFIILAKSFLDASVAWGARTYFPLFLNYIALLAVLQSGNIFKQEVRDKMRYILPKVVLVVVAINGISVWNLRSTGVGYNSTDWRQFEFINILPAHANRNLVYTNDQAALLFHGISNSTAKLLPEKKNLFNRKENDAYTAEMDVVIHELQQDPASEIVWIRNGVTAEVYPSYEELREHPDLEIVYDDWLCLIMKAK